jgi:hypothetical protein
MSYRSSFFKGGGNVIDLGYKRSKHIILRKRIYYNLDITY